MNPIESKDNNCRVFWAEQDWAPIFQSDRTLNPNNMVCPPWPGVDAYGRPSSSISHNNALFGQAGCHNASERILVENQLRPQYVDNIQLNPGGIHMFCNSATEQSGVPNSALQFPKVAADYTLDPMSTWNSALRQVAWDRQMEHIRENRILSGFAFH